MIEEWKIYKCKKDKNHPCVLEAGEICGIWKGGISTVLHGKQKTAGGYKWIYKEDYQKCIN